MTKEASNKFIDTVDECLTNGVRNGIFHVSVQDKKLDGRHVTIDGKKVVNFGSCSYMGLEVDERLKKSVIEAAQNYGVQYSASRAFSSCNLYEELEVLLRKVFDNNHVIFAPTTTLTHIAAIPILVQNNDLVILDHQVHGSVQMAVQLAKAKGTKVEMIRHNRMDLLEDLIKENPNKYEKIWYMADGVYSMYGDVAPLTDLVYLLEKYSNFYVYVDDAHGMSWAGKNGGGYVLSQIPLHPKMALSTSLSKGFGAAGGALILSDAELKRKILTCGSSYTFSGPEHPPMLAASIASAKIHLSNDIYALQDKLRSNIEHAQKVIDELQLPSVARTDSPIFYLGLGMPRVGYNMVRKLLAEGFYANIGIFPAVPVKCTGLRLPITNGHTHEDITNVLKAFEYHLPKVLEEEKTSVDQISKSFNLPMEDVKRRFGKSIYFKDRDHFNIQHETTIHKVDKIFWDEIFGDKGMFDWEGCRFIEETFSENAEVENNWNFHYLIIRDQTGKAILATFFTELISKDDMISSSAVSEKVEEVRRNDKYYLTSRVIMLGSLVTVGDHLYVNRIYAKWREAVVKMIHMMNEIRQLSGASMIQLRDFDTSDDEIKDFLLSEGFVRVKMPDNHVVKQLNWKDETDYMNSLSTKSRWHFRRNILDKKDFFSVTVLDSETTKRESFDLDLWYSLYLNVKNKSYNINTYALPPKYFVNMIEHPNWEIIEIKLRAAKEKSIGDSAVALAFCYKSAGGSYSIVAVGLNYDYVLTHGSYRQSLYQAVVRARNLNAKSLLLGMDASIEKRKFGAQVIPKSAFIQANDNFNFELMMAVY